MGIFNMFIVIPQIIAALGGINFTYKLIFGEEVIYTMVLAGCSLILAGLSNFWIACTASLRSSMSVISGMFYFLSTPMLFF